eukprot:7446803-Pyramimonas_sp.AAC.1
MGGGDRGLRLSAGGSQRSDGPLWGHGLPPHVGAHGQGEPSDAHRRRRRDLKLRVIGATVSATSGLQQLARS